MAVVITRQPTHVYVPHGGTAVFTVEATGVSSYAWQLSADGVSWSNINGYAGVTGATTNTMSISNVGSYHEQRTYRCVLKDSAGNQTVTDAVGLTQTALCVITKQPTDIKADIGDKVTLTVEAENTTYYEWQYSTDSGTTWTRISAGGDGSTPLASYSVTVEVTQETHKRLYRCELRDKIWWAAYTDTVRIYAAKAIPVYEYSGEHEAKSDSSYWYIILKSSGTLKFKRKKTIDAILVGGGGSGQNGDAGAQLRGGASGYATHVTDYFAAAKTEYTISIGAGGARGSNQDGNPTSAFGKTANGGESGARGGDSGYAHGGGTNAKGGDGFLPFGSELLNWVCGAGGGGSFDAGEYGTGSGGEGGKGGGGHGGWLAWSGDDAVANTGGGGGGGGRNAGQGLAGNGGAGGSGVVIIRGAQDDGIPVMFDGVELSSIVFDGVTVQTLIVDGVMVF